MQSDSVAQAQIHRAATADKLSESKSAIQPQEQESRLIQGRRRRIKKGETRRGLERKKAAPGRGEKNCSCRDTPNPFCYRVQMPASRAKNHQFTINTLNFFTCYRKPHLFYLHLHIDPSTKLTMTILPLRKTLSSSLAL
jgi:hypothetical protein